MKITIEIPCIYYESEWICDDGSVVPPPTNKAQEILMSAEIDWKDFAFEMANILGEKLKEMSDEHERKNSHLERCFHQASQM